MAENVTIRGVEYDSVPSITIPRAGSSGNAVFTDTSDATLTTGANLPAGVSAYSGGIKYDGTAPVNDSGDLSAAGATVTAPAGFYEQNATKTINSGTVTAPATISGSSASVSSGSNTITLTKTVSVVPNVTEAGYISSGTAGNASVSLTASVTTKGAATLQPGTSAVTISAGTYITGAQTIPAEPNYVAANIVAGKSLWGLAGSAAVPVISQDSVTKILSIS